MLSMKNIEQAIYEIMVYINLNLFEYITLDELSSRFSYSKYHLHRKFKDIVGINLNDYIKRRRIESSIYYLSANPEASITEVAGYCGYSSATYSREFRKVFNRKPTEWRNIYKKDKDFKKDSNICKNYEQFICYNDYGIPREIKNIGTAIISKRNINAVIYYGNYHDERVRDIWNTIDQYNSQKKPFILISMNSPAVTNINCCLYVLGFDGDSDISGLSSMMLEGGEYLVVDYEGSREKLIETYTWIIKYYLSNKGLKYDYRVQFHEYDKIPDLGESNLSCRIHIPICHA